MNKTHFLTAVLLTVLCTTSSASQIRALTLPELYEKADLIVMAEVVQIDKEGDRDRITIKADCFLKGKSPQTVFTFTLVTRGGLKDFDPCLQKGDTGVFFLKHNQEQGQVEKAYWGSIAVFPKNHFGLSDLSTGLEAWRTYRVNRSEIGNIEDYDRGFQKGFNGPPGLVDNSADFNLGHSDGMRSKMNILPGQQQAPGN